MSAARHDAIMAHWERFQVDPPMSILVGEAAEPAFVAAVDRAIKRGRPLSQAEVYEIAGVKAPGPDPDPGNPRTI